MARYTDDSREKVRDAVDFVDLVGSRVELRKAGVAALPGLCPFHEERSPSFGIDPVEKLYHCFGCGAGRRRLQVGHGDSRTSAFGEALEILADRYNVAAGAHRGGPAARRERRARRDRLHALLERTAAYYVRLLWESAEAAGAREYLASRGLSEATAREFRVGYSLRRRGTAWSSARGARASRRTSCSPPAWRSGRASGPGLIDRFRGRLMFPWADARGRVLGFGARALQPRASSRSTSTPPRARSSTRAGTSTASTSRARGAAKAGSVVLVEGYTDVIALHQAGIRNAVGQHGDGADGRPGGRARQARADGAAVPRRRHGRPEGDAQGGVGRPRRCARRRSCASCALPAGADPADVVAREGAEAMRERLGARGPVRPLAGRARAAPRRPGLGGGSRPPARRGRARWSADCRRASCARSSSDSSPDRLGLSELLVATSLRDGGRPAVARPRNGSGAGHPRPRRRRPRQRTRLRGLGQARVRRG